MRFDLNFFLENASQINQIASFWWFHFLIFAKKNLKNVGIAIFTSFRGPLSLLLYGETTTLQSYGSPPQIYQNTYNFKVYSNAFYVILNWCCNKIACSSL